MSAPQSIPLLRFCVGSMHFAIAAEDVVAVTPAQGGAVHIGAVLDLDPAPRDGRVIHLASRSEASFQDKGPPLVAFQADSPVDVIRLSSDDLLPVPAAFPSDRWKPVIGFAQVPATPHAPEGKRAQASAGASPQLILLLDIPSVIAKLMQDRRGGPL